MGRIRKAELPLVLEIWKESFKGELSQRGMDLGEIAPVFRMLLSLRRFPLWLLHRLGVPVEIWAVRVRGRPVGGVGQIGYRIPYIIGLVVRPENRELRLVRILERGIAAGLKAAGYSLMRAHVPDGHGIAKLSLKLGWELLGHTRHFILSLKDLPPEAASLRSDVRGLGIRREGTLARKFHHEGNVRALLSVERNYGGPVVRIFGFRERILAAGRGNEPLGIARISWNTYQPIAFMHVPFLRDGDTYVGLLAAAIRHFKRLGKEELHLDLWEEQKDQAGLLRDLGAREGGRWNYLIKRL